jgi:hypothetical protein
MPSAMRRSSSGLGRLSLRLIIGNLAAVGLSRGNESNLAVALDIDDDVQPILPWRHRDPSSLAVISPRVLEFQRLAPSQGSKIAKIDSVFGEIAEPLVLIPRWRHLCSYEK